MRERGITLIELLIVVSIIGILMVALGFSYEGWMGNYRLESQTKELYIDLADARSSAMSHNRVHWVVLEDQQYTIVEDDNPGPDGDGILDAQDELVLQKRYEYDFRLASEAPAVMPQTITFDRRGLMSWAPAANEMTFMFINTRDPDYDCIRIERARRWMVEYEAPDCERR